jgi:hypothetical protein
MSGVAEVQLAPNYLSVRVPDCFSLQPKSKSRGEFLHRHGILEATLNVGAKRPVCRVKVDLARSAMRNKARQGMKLQPIKPEYITAYMDCVTGTLYDINTLCSLTSELLCITSVAESDTIKAELRNKREPDFEDEQW